MDKLKVDIIVSCYNEEENIIPFYSEAIKYFNDDKYKYNIVFVNDGSSDHTYDVIKELQNSYSERSDISVISFDKNRGHEAAMCAGFDLQNPPGKIPEILREFEKGADCVLLRRVKYSHASFIKVMTSRVYYLFSQIVLRNKNARDVSDFFAVNYELAKTVSKNYKTRLRFVRSFVQNEAKNIHFVNYENGIRNAGVSRYNYLKLAKLAIISELSRSKTLREIYKATKENPVYIIDDSKTKYI